MIYSIIFYGKELTFERSDGSLSLFQLTGIVCSIKIAQIFSLSHDIYSYLELVCHDKQNGDQQTVLQLTIAELYQFELRKAEKDDKEGLSLFKPGLW